MASINNLNLRAMIGKIYHITNHQSELYERGTFVQFQQWAVKQYRIQVDVETNVTKWWNERIIISIQFGSCTSERVQWFLQWSELTEFQIQWIAEKILENRVVCKLGHNISFEYTMFRFYGIVMENVYDTMIGEKVLQGGLEIVNYDLADISWKYLRIQMNKALQTSFGDNVIDDEKILYGITDVAYLDVICRQQIEQGDVMDLLYVMGLEMDAILPFADITWEGMTMDKVKWRENEALAKPLVIERRNIMNAWLETRTFKETAIKKGYISDTDQVKINWQAPQQKSELLQLIFPDIIGAGMPIIRAYIRDHSKELGTEKLNLLVSMLSKDYKPFLDYLIAYHREYLVDNEYIIPAGYATINWNSVDQALPMIQLVEPKLTGLSEKERARGTHKILKDREEYTKVLKLVSDLGEAFIENHVGPDGRVRTRFNQIVSTGRCSSSDPNMQNITVDESVGTRYRNAFLPNYPGWVFVDSDYVSQELVIIAFASKDPVWLEAINKGWDIHSIVAKMMYKQKWDDATEKDCAFAEKKHKCNCKKHKIMRYDCKTIDFGLAYGMTEYKLARELEITVPQARKLMEDFFFQFPNIGRTLQFLGEFGVRNGYIITLAPFYRRRSFPFWREYRPWIEAHIQGIKNVGPLGEIERAAKNHPIQGTAADMMKVSMVLVRNHIVDNNLWDKIRLNAQVHDQLTTSTPKEYAEEWKPKFDFLMREAAKVIIPSGILTADTTVSPVWTK